MFGTYEEYVSFSIWIIPEYSIVPIEIVPIEIAIEFLKVPIGMREIALFVWL
jgi:hypothetical protein